jgi:hypothetical protein
VEKKADYVLALKGNQGSLREDPDERLKLLAVAQQFTALAAHVGTRLIVACAPSKNWVPLPVKPARSLQSQKRKHSRDNAFQHKDDR